MARCPREDEPGCFLHVFNRGLSKRSVFETRPDVRYFLSRIAREHRRGRLRVHSYSTLTNHFHLLAESPVGQVSEALRVIQNEYVRRFNRLRKRDGPLFRGRFGSRRVRSEAYWWTLLRYIDLNAVEARLASSEGLYAFGSARHYLRREGPKWLTRQRVEQMLMVANATDDYDPLLYERFLSHPLSDAERDLVELRMAAGRDEPDPLDRVIKAGPAEVRDWMREKAERADGTHPGIPIVAPKRLISELDTRRQAAGDWSVRPRRRGQGAWDVMLAGMLRDACGLSYREIGTRLGIALSCAESRARAHRMLMLQDELYADRAASALDACFGSIRMILPGTEVELP